MWREFWAKKTKVKASEKGVKSGNERKPFLLTKIN